MKPYGITTEIKNKIIDLYGKKYKTNDIASIVGCSQSNIYYFLKKHNIYKKNTYYYKLSESVTSEIIDLYINKKLSANEIGKKFNVSSTTVQNILHRNNINIRPPTVCHAKHRVDETFFKKIDTHIKAQILGFIYADGCISNNSLIIQLNKKDLDYLQFIKKELNFSGDIKFVYDYHTKGKDMIRLVITNVNIVNDLKYLGCWPRKSLTLMFPTIDQVPDEFINSFILGYIEGDGCITINKKFKRASVGFCSTVDFCINAQKIIKNKLNLNGCIYDQTEYKNRNINFKYITYGGLQQSLILFEWLYKNVSFRMRRKYNKFKEIIDFYKSENIIFRPLKRNGYKKLKYYEDLVQIYN